VSPTDGKSPSTPAAGRRAATAIDILESALHSLGRSLRRSRLHEALLAEAGVDVDRAGVALLYVLYGKTADLRLTDLADELHIDAPAVTRKAQQLERAGLIRRSRDREDGRATRLGLTASGRRAIERILAARRAWLVTLVSDWPEAEQIEFARLLDRFTDGVERNLEDLDV
jgi:DNA-binding MarR family transcriptional regulator